MTKFFVFDRVFNLLPIANGQYDLGLVFRLGSGVKSGNYLIALLGFVDPSLTPDQLAVPTEIERN